MITKHVPSKEELKAIHSKHGAGGSSIHIHDIYTGDRVRVKKPEFLKHVKKHKNKKITETIIATGNHPKVGHRVRQIVHKKTC